MLDTRTLYICGAGLARVDAAARLATIPIGVQLGVRLNTPWNAGGSPRASGGGLCTSTKWMSLPKEGRLGAHVDTLNHGGI